MSESRSPARSRSDLVQALTAKRAGYAPGWHPVPGEPGYAVLQITGRYLERLERDIAHAVPTARIAFLDALGERRLPAQSAETPVTFVLSQSAARDAAVPAGTLLLAEPDPRDPQRPPPAFVTIQSFVATRASLVCAYTKLPREDRYADHTADLGSGFTVLEAELPVEHTVYLGSELFNLPAACAGAVSSRGSEVELQLRFDFRRPLGEESPLLPIAWEFLAEGGWYPLAELPDGQARPESSLFGHEVVSLRKEFGPESTKTKLRGRESYWIRARLQEPILPLGVDGSGRLPVVDRIFASLRTRVMGLKLDAAVFDAMSLDVGAPFFPFGRLPREHDCVYLACKKAFERPNARIGVLFDTDAKDALKPTQPAASEPTLAWEYFDGYSWSELTVVEIEPAPPPAPAAPPPVYLSFQRPGDWQPCKVGGKEDFWLRIRIKSGDFTTTSTTGDPPTINAPVVRSLSFIFEESLGPAPVRLGVTSNDFVERDVSNALGLYGRTFAPFTCDPTGDVAFHLAFDRALPPARVSLYAECAGVRGDPDPSRFIWEYQNAEGWQPLSVIDNTASLSRSGTIEFMGPWDARPSEGLGGTLFRIRARLKQGSAATPLQVRGLWHNATLARNERNYAETPLGVASGNPASLLRAPVSATPILEREVVEIREWVRGQSAPPLPGDLPENRQRVVKDPSGAESEIWVRWESRDTLLASGPEERHYTVDRATGTLRFGDGAHGRIPPAGASVVLRHRSGGGLAGNATAAAVSQVVSAVSGLERVHNPIAARGGAPSESIEDAVVRGGRRLLHGDRAVSVEDYEWLAREATPAVARARCLPLTGPGGLGDRGWVTLVIIPHSSDAQPVPDPELIRRVGAYMAAHAPAAVARRIRVVAPVYAPLKVVASLIPKRTADLTRFEADARAALDAFLHPLSGGPHGAGWVTGQAVYLSQVARVLAGVPGVDLALALRLQIDGAEQGEVARVPLDAIVSAGRHELSFAFEEAI